MHMSVSACNKYWKYCRLSTAVVSFCCIAARYMSLPTVETGLGRYVKYLMYFDFNQIWIFSSDFRRSPRDQILRESVQWKWKTEVLVEMPAWVHRLVSGCLYVRQFALNVRICPVSGGCKGPTPVWENASRPTWWEPQQTDTTRVTCRGRK
jgi:hypothetical protein